MDRRELSKIIRSIKRSELRILMFLALVNEASLKELVEVANTSTEDVRASLDKLERLGLVASRRIGKMRLFRLVDEDVRIGLGALVAKLAMCNSGGVSISVSRESVASVS